MIITQTKMMAEFSHGSVIIGSAHCQVNEASEFWYVSIRQAANIYKVGEMVEKEAVMKESDEIILTFPSENQMLKVMAAFSNKTFEELVDKWMKKKSDKRLQDIS